MVRFSHHVPYFERGTKMNRPDDSPKNSILIYTTEDGLTKIDTTFDGDTVWLSIDQMAELFQRDKSTISRHIKNIFAEGELERDSVVAKFATTAADGKTYQVEFYNLDVIISVGYRVKSKRGTQFRIWATGILKEYMSKGFALDDERLKNLGGGGYFKELLERIRDIRASEKVFYRQVLEIYATSIDYDPKAEVSVQFFKKVQNKIHYAIHGQTAAEVIYNRADAEKEFMGLNTFAGNQPTLQEATIAKNYLAVAFKYRIHAPRTFYYHVLKSTYTVKSSFRRSVFTVHALFHMTPSAFYRKFLLKLLLFLNFFLFKYICKQEKSKAQSI